MKTALKTRAARKPADARVRYVETSALVAAILEGDRAARASIRHPGKRVTSALTLAEASRAVLRARMAGRITASQANAASKVIDTFSLRCDIVHISPAVLKRASQSFPVEPVRTLDAIHLATLHELGEPPSATTVITRDARIRENAAALGYRTD